MSSEIIDRAAGAGLDPDTLRRTLSELMGIELTQDDDDSNVFELGLQSIELMRLANRLNRAGAEVTFAQLADDPRLRAWSDLLAGTVVAERPAATGPGPHDSSVFPLTPVQQAYLIGRAGHQPLGGVGCHNYLEFDLARVEPHRLDRAVRRLIERHPMLRACFVDDATHRILAESPWPGMTVRDWRDLPAEQAEAAALDLRAQQAHRVLDVSRGEVLDVHLTRLPGGVDRLHFNVDLLVADLASFRLMLIELAALYDDPGSLGELTYSFGRYLADMAEVRRPERERARAYWQRRLPELPGGPRLPLAVEPEAAGVPRFARRYFELTGGEWQVLERRAGEAGLTPAAVLATAYSLVLARWSGDDRFLLNLPLFDRDLDAHPEIGGLVGDFTGLLLLEVDLAGEGFAERARAVQRRLHEDIGHASYTGVEVLRDLARTDRDAPRTAPVVFSYDLSAPLIPDEFAARFGDATWMLSQTPQIWLDHQIYRTRDGGVRLVWDAVEALFPAGMLDAMMAAYQGVVRGLLDGDWEGAPRIELPAVQVATRAEANTRVRAMSGGLLHTAFFERATERAGRPALLWGTDGAAAAPTGASPEAAGGSTGGATGGAMGGSTGGAMAHDELARRALAVGGALARRGVGRGSTVAVIAPKGPDQIAAVLGVLAAGAAYVPIGVDQPAERRARILELSGARVVLDGARLPGTPGVETLPIGDALRARPLGAPVPADPGDPAYVIFTSGSTGLPKGVELSHRAALNTVEDINERFGIGPADRVLAVSALDFDLSVWDLFGLLAAGGAAVLVPESGRRDAAAWLSLCRAHGVTVWNTVPALLDMALTAAADAPLPGTLRLALLSGDWIGLDLPARLARATAGRCRLIALGGATEAAIWSNAFEVAEVEEGWRSIPYGTPLRNQRFRVVDGRGRDCPDWVPGELWIGGSGVALGYRGDPELTAARFPVHEGERWYRTGDLGRYWPDGNLEFLGRLDHQVKINGFRVELGEIESCLQADPAVAQAVAMVVSEGRKEVVAAVVETPPSPMPTVPEGPPVTSGDLFLPPSHGGEPAEHHLVEILLAELLAPRLAAPYAGVCDEQRPVLDLWLAYLARRSVLARTPGGFERGPRWDEVTGAAWVERVRQAAQGTRLEHVVTALEWSVPLYAAILTGEADATALLDDPVLAPEALNDLMPATARCLAAIAGDLRARGAEFHTVAEWDVTGWLSAARLLAALDEAPGDDGHGDDGHGDDGQVTERRVDYTLLGSSGPALAKAEKALREEGHEPQVAVQGTAAIDGRHVHTFDAVVAVNALHRMTDPETAAATMALLLAPGGRLYLLERAHPTPLALLTALPLEARAGRFELGRANDAWLHGPGRWTRACLEAGLTGVRVLRAEDTGEILLTADRPETATGIDTGRLRQRAAARLPEHMAPAHYSVLPSLPLSANGKVDRRRIEEILRQSADRPRDVGDPPRGPTERFVAERWTKLLGLDSVGRDENFFRLGGDSLLATRLVAEVRGAWGVDLPMREVMRAPTVAGLSTLIDTLGGQAGDDFEEGAV
ncbi:non-ribosomal peptide synthetase [Nonomuraea soli]|uniref:Phenyloxazoline synthase MbtB n=1 Tax=Nonomuraea soli TaxID=1032476 RepID=A0A7W0CGN1_9ACTN|nr:non-ribosomal peptide synthetase [Nonomuraea soli]MBA2890862.1 dihydroaeruginoic acid synthetase [Nonomuraea soli]